ncbi:MAG: peptide ABC transporter substrate-binding protein [Phycisphaerales bacterium]|nr:peptide ABC transporter substrate-binding protein [Phycisphaerales bacterium]
MLKFLLPVAILVAAVVAVFSFDDPEPRSDFVFINRSDVFTLDPQRMSWLNDMQMAYCLYEGLVRWNPTDFSIELAAADSLVESEDGMSYTFHIRNNARWSNGAPLTSHDFQYSWMRLLTPDSAADYSDFFFSIRGSRAYWDWRSQQLANKNILSDKQIELKFQELVGIKVIDDKTIRVELEHPVPYFLDQLALAVCSPVYRPCVEGWIVGANVWSDIKQIGWHAVDAPTMENRKWLSIDASTGRLKQLHTWARPGRLVCNGPFVLAQWRYKRDMRLERNPHFHSPEQTSLNSIRAITIADTNTAIMSFESGAADWLNGVNADYQSDMLAQKERGKRTNIHSFPTFGTDFFSFNCRERLNSGENNPFNNPSVRRAFVLATNRKAIVQHATRLGEPIVSSFVPPNSIEGYKTVLGIGFDPENAKKELSLAGWEDRDGDGYVENQEGKLFPVVEVLYTTNTPRYKWMALELRDQWQKLIGVRVELRGTDNKFFSSDLKSGNFMVARGRWYGDYGDPTTFLDVFRSDSGNNDRGYVNYEIDDALNIAAKEQNPKKRMEMLRKIEQRLFTQEVPMLVICQLLQLYMYEPEVVSGLTTHPRLTQQLWRVRVNNASDN